MKKFNDVTETALEVTITTPRGKINVALAKVVIITNGLGDFVHIKMYCLYA